MEYGKIDDSDGSDNEDVIKEDTVFRLIPELIVNHKDINGLRWYLIKWKGASHRHDVWLPVYKLINCQLLLKRYLSNAPTINVTTIIQTITSEQETNHLYNVLKYRRQTEIHFLTRDYLTASGLKLPFAIDKSLIMTRLENYIRKRIDIRNNRAELKEIRREILLKELLVRRERQLRELNRFELEINLISDHSELILVENLVDLEILPRNFVYINEYLIHPSIKPLSTSSSLHNDGCRCGVNNCYGTSCCPDKMDDGCRAYNRSERMIESKGVPIYECNEFCDCDENCVNRLTQRGCKVKLCIFRTFNGCGWGVRALQLIPKGTFITRYLGEVVTWQEANERGSKNEDVRRYLFDMDYNKLDESTCEDGNDKESSSSSPSSPASSYFTALSKLSPSNDGGHCIYTVDAHQYSNVARFINHSCSPNLTVYSVWINRSDPNFHHLCLFANRNIKPGEEITFDYSYSSGEKSPISPCKCNSENCKDYHF